LINPEYASELISQKYSNA
jgi:hypothetical protein